MLGSIDLNWGAAVKTAGNIRKLVISYRMLQDRIELHSRRGSLRFPIAAAWTLPQKSLARKATLPALITRRRGR